MEMKRGGVVFQAAAKKTLWNKHKAFKVIMEISKISIPCEKLSASARVDDLSISYWKEGS